MGGATSATQASPALILRGNLHAHTTFSDGVRSPAELVADYEALGYDFLAITDHDDLLTDDYWTALEDLATGLLLFHGVEMSWQAFPQHVGRIFGDRETLSVLNHPGRYNLSLDDTLERIRLLGDEGLVLDAVEVTDTGRYRSLYHSEQIPLVKVATDDAHRPQHFGRAWIEVDVRRDRDAIIRAVRAGDFRLGLRQDID